MAGAFEFSADPFVVPPGAIVTLRPRLGARTGFSVETDVDADGTADAVVESPARGALRASKESGQLALRWRPNGEMDALETTGDLGAGPWLDAGAPITTEGPDRVARVDMTQPAQFFRVRTDLTNCHSLAMHPLGPKPNPWETNRFKFEAENAFGAPQPFNEIVTRSGATGLDVGHTVRIHPQDDCEVMHLDVRQTSGNVLFEAVGPLGTVVSRQQLLGPGTEIQRVTLRSFRGRIHLVRVISPNALCLIANICCEPKAQTVPPAEPQSCVSFENMEPDFLNSPAPFGLIDISTDQGPLAIEPVAGLGVNGVKLTGNITIQVNVSFGTCRRVTQAYDISGFTWLDSANTLASPEPQTIVLEGPGISRIWFAAPHAQGYLLEFCCERDSFQFP
jgi:hypothetical protein